MIGKRDLILLISSKVGCTQDTVSAVLREFQLLLLQEIKKEKRFPIIELGSLKIVRRKERVGINPITKDRINIPSKEAVRFSPSRKFKDFISGKESDIFSFNF